MQSSIIALMRPLRGRNKGDLQKPPAPAELAAVETVLIGAAFPLILVLLTPVSFRPPAVACIALCPLVLGLKHGRNAGLFSAGLAAAVMAIASSWSLDVNFEFPKVSAVVGLIAGLLAGHTRDKYEARLRKLWSSCDLQRMRLAEHRAAYQVIQIAHAELERKLGSSCSLRTSLERLERASEQIPGQSGDELRRFGTRVMEIFRNAAPLYSAALFLQDSSGALACDAAAVIGDASRELAAYPDLPQQLCAAADTSRPESGKPLAIIALRDVDGQARGALVIADMAFDAICPETFEHIGALARHAARCLARRARPLDTPGDLETVRAELRERVREARHAGTALSVLACEFPSEIETSAYLGQSLPAEPSLDLTWVARKPRGAAVVIKTLRLADDEEAEAFARRMNTRLAAQFPGVKLAPRAWTFMPNGSDDPTLSVDAALAALVGQNEQLLEACS